MDSLEKKIFDVVENAISNDIFWFSTITSDCITTDWRVLPFWVFLHVQDGLYECEIEETQHNGKSVDFYQCSPGEIIMIPSGVKHRLIVPKPTLAEGIHVRYNLFNSLDILSMTRFPVTISASKCADIKQSLSGYTKALETFEKRPCLKHSALKNSYGQMLFHDILCLSPNGFIDTLDFTVISRIAPAIKLIDENLCSVKVEDMAKICSMCNNNFTRLFRKATGLLPVKYLRMKRLEFAMSRLVYTNDKIYQIASDAGYFDQFHFSKVFRAEVGESPSNYRTNTRRTLAIGNPTELSERK